MLTEPAARAFADEWIAAWNSHELPRILAHWADACEFTSPIAARLLGGDGVVRGKPALAAYWRRGLEANPDLRFELDHVLVGTDSLVIAYRNHRGQRCGEWLRLDAAGHAVAGAAHYA
ncbi:MAG: nuclear transport factor 2 family protein [Polyangiaceae bacterium]